MAKIKGADPAAVAAPCRQLKGNTVPVQHTAIRVSRKTANESQSIAKLPVVCILKAPAGFRGTTKGRCYRTAGQSHWFFFVNL